MFFGKKHVRRLTKMRYKLSEKFELIRSQIQFLLFEGIAFITLKKRKTIRN